MPYSARAERFFRLCQSQTGKAKGKCPDRKFLKKFSAEKKAGMKTKG